MPFSQLGDVGLGQDHNVGSPRGNGNYTNLGSNNHGTVLLASNLYMDDGSDNLKIANNHPTMAGAAIQIPGNGQPRQNHIEFWTTPPNAVNQGQDFGDIHNLRVVVTPDGNVGIGTANPTAKAEIRVENEGDWALKLQSGPNDFFDVRPINVGGRFQTELNTANNRDLVILPGTGNVLIGTTVPTTSARLTVEAIGPDSGDFTFAAGVVGRALNPTGVPDLFRQTAGVRGINDDGHGVQGQSDSHIGVEGTSNSGTAVFAQSDSGVGVWGVTNSGPFAGFFQGPVHVAGTLSKSGGGFRIDHPLDSANKYLNHSFVESPEMKNVYDGVAVLDANGEAAVMLPDWFEALNEGFRYQLTPVGAPAPQLHVANEIAHAQFRIAGGVPGQRVCWQVTGVRKDPWARAHPVVVEEPKTDDERGSYLNPELFGQGEDQSIMVARYPNLRRRQT